MRLTPEERAAAAAFVRAVRTFARQSHHTEAALRIEAGYVEAVLRLPEVYETVCVVAARYPELSGGTVREFLERLAELSADSAAA